MPRASEIQNEPPSRINESFAMNHIAASRTMQADDHQWRLILPLFSLVVIAILLIFRHTFLGMAGIWARSDTYAHGFVVLPITLWLIWRKRSEVARLTPRPSYSAWLLLAGVGFSWLLGDLAAVNSLTQFAAVGMLVLAVPAVLGWPVARALAFSLLFLFFSVPLGDFAMPKLMDWTAAMTIFGLRLTGIPVHAEGLRFVIPSGSWSVVEACSGVRYLIASITVGTLFAYLTYHSLKRRILFVLASIIVPVIANWLRAYMIVMIGHLSSNRLAVGVDHVVYGWLFFGLVMMAMFWVGGRWREDHLPRPVKRGPEVPAGGAASVPLLLIGAAATVMIAATGPLISGHLDDRHSSPLNQIAALATIPGWQPAEQATANWQPSYSGANAQMHTAYEKEGRVAALFIGYYRQQDNRRKLVTSTNGLVRSNDQLWVMTASGARGIGFDNQDLKVRWAQLRSSSHARLTVWQWYWIDGRWTASDSLAKAYMALARLMGKGDDSAVVILYAAHEQGVEAQAILEEFAAAAAAPIGNALRQTAESR